MIHGQRTKVVPLISPASFTNGATASGTVDCKGFDYASIDIVMSTSNTTSNNPSVCNLLDCDTTVATSFATVSGFVGDTDWTIPTADTANANVIRFNVDCRKRKRYLEVNVSPTTTQVMSITANLSRAESDDEVSNQGANAVVNG